MRAREGAALPAVLVIVVASLLAACSGGGSPQRDEVPADYRAVPDRELFAAVESLPTVRSSDLRYVDQLGETNTYRGTVRLSPGASAEEVTGVFDDVVEILRHGRYGAAYVVKVVSGSEVRSGAGVGLYTGRDFDRRYGPQEGQQGWPPQSVDNAP